MVRAVRLRFGLDWSPNTTHVALIVAQGCGAFARRGLEVEFVAPDDNGAPKTPADGLCDGSLEFGLCPCDQLVTRGVREELVAVAALVRVDISAVVVSAESGIDRPRKLVGRSYSSCGYPLEVATINALIAADGGQGCVVEECPPMRMESDVALHTGEADCAWQYETWEVLRAKRQGKALNVFRLRDFGVKFGYMNCITAKAGSMSDEVIRTFLDAVREGAEYAVRDPTAAANLLYQGSGKHPELADAAFVAESIEMLRDLGALGDFAASSDGSSSLRRFGEFDPQVWADFGAWMEDKSIIAGEEQLAAAVLACGEEPGRTVWTNAFIVR